MSNHGCAGFWRLVVAYRNLPIALAWRMVLVGGPASVECGLLCLGWCLARLCSEMGTISMVVTGTYDPSLVALSILVDCFASYTALALAWRVVLNPGPLPGN